MILFGCEPFKFRELFSRGSFILKYSMNCSPIIAIPQAQDCRLYFAVLTPDGLQEPRSSSLIKCPTPCTERQHS
jgi:hypothetical protein